MMCSQCGVVRYCNSVCQKNDWQQHRGECKSVTRTVNLNESIGQDVCLLLRTNRVLKQSKAECTYNQDSSISCGTNHIDGLCISGDTQRAVDEADGIVNIIQQIAPNNDSKKNKQSESTKKNIRSEDNKKNMRNLLLKFRCNNFGIVDDLMQCVGAGVYPAVALLNHSCQPTCLLRYVISQGRPVRLQVIAVRDITAGEELTHSYVDLAEPTAGRQDKLSSVYGFSCMCDRCNGSVMRISKFPEAFLLTGSYEHLLRYTVSDEGEGVPIDEEEAMKACTAENSSLSVSAARCLLDQSSGAQTPQEEIGILSGAISLLTKLCGPFHTELYRAHGQLLTAHLLSGNYEGALSACLKVVGFLYLVLRDVPKHPLLGLQLFTLGDIMSEVGRPKEDVRIVYSMALDILVFAYGLENSLVQRLQALLESSD